MIGCNPIFDAMPTALRRGKSWKKIVSENVLVSPWCSRKEKSQGTNYASATKENGTVGQ